MYVRVSLYDTGTTHYLYYRVCHELRLTKQEDYFWDNFDHFWIEQYFLEAAGTVMKIGSSLKPNHHWEIELAQIHETLCRNYDFFHN